MKAYEIPYDLKTGNNKQAEIHIGIRLAKFVIYFSRNSVRDLSLNDAFMPTRPPVTDIRKSPISLKIILHLAI